MIVPFEKELTDYSIITAVNLERYSQGLQQKVVAILSQAQKEILAEVLSKDPTATKLRVTRKLRATKLSSQIDYILKKSYKSISDTVVKELSIVAALEAKSLIGLLNNLISINLFQANLTDEYLKSIVENTLIQGGTIREWFNTQAKNASQRLTRSLADAVYKSNLMQIGKIRGDSISNLVSAVRGMTVDGKSGPLKLSRREAETLVKTSVMQVINQTRYIMLMENEDLLKGFMIIAVLDTKTSSMCESLDHTQYDLEWNSLGGRKSKISGPPPWHWGCRSVYIPILDKFSDIVERSKKGETTLGKRLTQKLEDKLLEVEERASANKLVPESINYNDWLKTQPRTVQIDVLGKARQKIWEDKGLPITDLVSQKNRSITLSELKKMYEK